MNLKEKSIRGLGWSAVQSWGGHAITLVVFATLARLLDPAAFALVALANVFIASVSVFADQGFADALVQRQDIEREHLDTAFWTNVGVGTGLLILGVNLSDPVANLFDAPELAPIIMWLSFIFLISSLASVQQALLRRKLEFRYLAIRNLIANVVGGVVGVFMALNGYGVWSLVGQQLVSAFVRLFVLWVVSEWRPRLSFSMQHFHQLFSFGINIVGIRLMEVVSRHSDNFLIGYFLGLDLLGYYAIAYKLIHTTTRLFTSVTGQVAFSSFSVLQKKLDEIRGAYYAAVKVTALLTIPAFVGLVILAPTLVPAIFGEKWGPSVAVTQVLAFAAILETIYVYNANVILAMGKPNWRLKINILNATTNLVFFTIAVQWGIVAVAAAYTIRAYLLSPIPIVLVRKLIQIEFSSYLSIISPQILSTAVMSVILVMVLPQLTPILPTFAAMAVAILLGIGSYLVAMLVIKREFLVETLAYVRFGRGVRDEP